MKSRAVVTGVLLGMALVSGGWWMQRGLHAPGGDAGQRARLFDQVLRVVERNYVSPLADSVLYRHAVNGLLHELNDPHSVFLAGDRLARLREDTKGRYVGIGVQLDMRDGWITVVSPFPGAPAEHAGVQTGDRIVAIDERSTRNWTSDEAQRALRGAPGSVVRLVVERPGIPERLSFPVTRREIRARAVRHAIMLRDGVGYVDLATFSEEAAAELRSAVDSLRARGMRALLFDLRGDPGGLLDQGVGIADLFLDPGQKIVSMRGRTPESNHDFVDRTPQPWPELRVVALVDTESASASEIVAGALQDHDRATLVGTPTYGKGSAQSLFPMGSAGALKLTTARWFTPSGRSINRPLVPGADDEDPDPPAAPDSEAKAPLFRTDAGRTVRGGGGIAPDIVVRDTAASIAERAFGHALGGDIPKFRDVLASFALSLRKRGEPASPDFEVTAAMRDELYRLLGQRGIAIDRAVFDGAAPLVDRWVGSQVARSLFGERAEFEREMRRDPVVQTALKAALGR